ncbi:MAG TPA: hypothetical protein VNH46_12580, partial [Gemmatimonadales bacterium]|nr:hypothetical protein [Gemmatimonadales bacterium]
TAGTGSFITTVPNGQTSQGFTFQGVEGASGTVGIVVSEPRFIPDTFYVTVVQPGVEIQGLLTTTTTLSGDDNFYAQVGVPNTTGTILQRAQNVRPGAPGPLNVTFTSRVTSVGTIVDSTSGAAGNVTGTARIPSGLYYTSTAGPAAGGVAFHPVGTGSTDITVGIAGYLTMSTNGTRTITVSQPTITVSSNYPQVGGGLQESGSVVLSAGNHGGASVTLASSDPTVALVATGLTDPGAPSVTVNLSNGQTSFTYYVQVLEGQTGGFTLTATEPRFTSGSTNVTAVTPGIEIQGLTTTTTTLSPNSGFYAQVGVLNGQATGLIRAQNVRGGAPKEVTATFTSTPASVGTIVDSVSGPNGAPTGTARIPIGRYYTQTGGNPANGGTAFHPLLSGQAAVSVAAPGFTTASTNGTRTITVTQPGISLSLNYPQVGSGLQESGGGSLGASNHGGVTVTLTSSLPSVLLLAPDASTPGQASIQIPVANGSTSFLFYVQGVEQATGTVT